MQPRYPLVVVDVPADATDDAASVLFELGAEGVEQRDEGTLTKGSVPGLATLVASFADQVCAAAATEALDPAWGARLSELVGDAWRDEWKKHYLPFRLTDRVTIRPPWEPYQATGPDEIVLELEPGRAFGTGLHATTALVARAIEACAERLTGIEVLDVGAGSGILSLIAVALGAGRARAIDVDPEAIAVTLDNAKRNHLEDRIAADTSSVGEIGQAYEVVVANIEARVLIEMARDLTACVRPGGVLLLSGILHGQEDEVARTFQPLALRSSARDGEWLVLILVAPT